MMDNLNAVVHRYDELTQEMMDPSVISSDRYLGIIKEHAELEPIVQTYLKLNTLQERIKESKELLVVSSDPEFKELVREEIAVLETDYSVLSDELRRMILPKDPNDKRSVIVEIRGGAGGEEAALFAVVLFRMYSYYAQQRHWSVDVVDMNATELGGLKEIVFTVDGEGAFSRLKYERGVHRVQRIPTTESGGRIHTSTVTVAVLPQVDDVEITINPSDLVIDTYRSSGAGGQHVNTTDSAIRITHKPTGTVVTCQDQRSQYKNKDKAMNVLKSKLYDMEQSRKDDLLANDRKTQVGTGDRSERIRTYNYPQSRVTDHRIGLTLYKLDDILQGNIDALIDPLIASDRAQALGSGTKPDSGEGRKGDFQD